MTAASQIAKAIEHTLLRPEATPAQIESLCEEAVRFSFHGVCVHPVHVRRAAEWLGRAAGAANAPVVVSVAGFPLGGSTVETKADEARRAMDDGAAEIDMVIHIGALIAGQHACVRREIETLARVAHGQGRNGILKVILECGALSEAQMIAGCRCCAEGEADFVKTSTGFHPSGGATVEQVRLLHRHAAPIRVKAAGGIRTASAAAAMLEAGASRIGTSASVAIIQELPGRIG